MLIIIYLQKSGTGERGKKWYNDTAGKNAINFKLGAT
jgi:hypothetical protein